MSTEDAVEFINISNFPCKANSQTKHERAESEEWTFGLSCSQRVAADYCVQCEPKIVQPASFIIEYFSRLTALSS